MGYQQPLVKVFQEFEEVSVATRDTELIPCIIGPCYHIIDIDEDSELSYAGVYKYLDTDNIEAPNNKTGAEVDEDSVKVKFKDVKVVKEKDVSFDTIKLNEIEFDSESSVDKFSEGDYVEVKDESGEVLISSAQVKEKDSENKKIKITLSVDGEKSYGKVNISKGVEDTIITDGVKFNSSGTIDISEIQIDDKDIENADVYIGYRSLRKDISDIDTAYKRSEAESKIGKLNKKDNPLGMGVGIALSNSTNSGVRFVATEGEDDSDFLDVVSKLEGYNNIYCVVPLSQSTAVTSAFASHVVQISTPNSGIFRITLINSDFPKQRVVAEGSGKSMDDSEGNKKLFKDVEASFIKDDVSSGDKLKLKSEEQEFIISDVVSDDILVLEEEIPEGENLEYKVTVDLNRETESEAIKEISSSYGEKRVVHVWPNECEIEGQRVPGYYLCCAVAGMIAGLPSHRGFTRSFISGVSRIYNSNDYFNRSQLNNIASGGTFIFVQDNPQSGIKVRHQLTTDTSTIENQELSFVKNFDYISILCQKTLDGFLGRVNISPNKLGVLETALRSTLKSLKLANEPRIGAPILNYSIQKVKQKEDERTRVEIYADVLMPYALNTVGLHLVSQ